MNFNILFFLIFYFLIFFNISFGNNNFVYIQDFYFDCQNTTKCELIKKRFYDLNKKYKSRKNLLKVLERSKTWFRNHDISYEVKDGGRGLRIYLTPDEILKVGKISIFSKSGVDLSDFLVPKEGTKILSKQIKVMVNDLKVLLKTKGYEGVEIEVDKTYRKDRVYIALNIKEESLWRVGGIKVTLSDHNLSEINYRLEKFKGDVWDKSKLNAELSNIAKYYIGEGFYLFKIRLHNLERNEDRVVIPNIIVDFGPKFGFDIRGNKVVSRESIVKKLRGLISEFDGDIDYGKIKNVIHLLYLDIGVYHSDIQVREYSSELKSFKGSTRVRIVKNYFIDIKEGHNFFVTNMSFLGSRNINQKKLWNFFLKKSSGISKRGLLREVDTRNFVEHLREYYLENGYIFCKVLGPFIDKDELTKTAAISYQVSEGKKVVWKNFSFKGISHDIKKIALENVQNREGEAINLVSLKSDIDRMEKNIKEKGYFFSRILNKKSTNIIHYSRDYKSADLYLNFDLGKISKFGDFVIVGLKLVKKDVIVREIFFQEGEEITPSKIQLLKLFLLKTNLFDSVLISILPGGVEEGDSLVITVREKKFGFFEIAPGFRSDVGFKLSSSIGYNNFLGFNHTIVLKGKIRQRLDDTSFDENRRMNNKNPLEFDALLKYQWPYFFSYPFDASWSLSFFRKKFRSFDDDIIRGSFALKREWSQFLSTTVKYQLEHNTKFNATNLVDEGSFSVASITPGLTLDFRDDTVNPTSGFIVNFSTEFARTYLGLDSSEQGISYNKMILRNASYFPLSPTMVIALSMTIGMQKNLAKNNSLPGIKIFRLNGIDRVRGFSSHEINRYYTDEQEASSVSIDDVDILDAAYLMNVKLEPRYYLSDSFVMAPFLDMGKISENWNHFLSPRVALGVSWKLVTPVGALNFDYGVKLDREVFVQDGGQVREHFGQFHFTLGSF